MLQTALRRGGGGKRPAAVTTAGAARRAPKPTPLSLVVDGHALIYRLLFAYKQELAKGGGAAPKPAAVFAEHGIRNHLARLRSLRVPDSASDVVFARKVIFCLDDETGRYARTAALPQYKAHRPVLAPPLREFLLAAIAAAKALPARHADVTTVRGADVGAVCEADDIIHSWVKAYASRRTPCIVCSHDKDLFQLIDEGRGVHYFSLQSKDYVTSQGCAAKLGVAPAQIADYLTLLGDRADNIPGVAGCGAVLSARLLEEHGTLEHVLVAAARGRADVSKKAAAALRADPAAIVRMRDDVIALRDYPTLVAGRN
jgi:DNA polymerase-1